MFDVRLFLTTSGVFIVLNIIENFIHFSIGRNIQNKDDASKLTLEMPTKEDVFKIVVIMLIFAFLQGLLTCYFDGCFAVKHI